MLFARVPISWHVFCYCSILRIWVQKSISEWSWCQRFQHKTISCTGVLTPNPVYPVYGISSLSYKWCVADIHRQDLNRRIKYLNYCIITLWDRKWRLLGVNVSTMSVCLSWNQTSLKPRLVHLETWEQSWPQNNEI